MPKSTALIEEHRALGGRIIDFGGWSLPVQYTSVLEEHQAVRNHCGLFDVSHMGEILIEGSTALSFTDYLLTNDVSQLSVHQAMYSALCDHEGHTVDDLVVYRIGDEQLLLVVNASNTEKDFEHILSVTKQYSGTLPKISNVSDQYSQLALQGPAAERVLQKLTQTRLSEIKTYWCSRGTVAGLDVLIARTGYTGEDGFELYTKWNDGVLLWKKILEAGASDQIRPCGLGARDTLRLEMKYALYGHELTPQTSPLEAGLGWVTKLGKASDFVGKPALALARSEGKILKTLVGLKSETRAIPRQGYSVFSVEGQKIGEITSGTSSPSLKFPIGIASIDKSFQKTGTSVMVKIREDLCPFQVVQTPFYQRKKS